MPNRFFNEILQAPGPWYIAQTLKQHYQGELADTVLNQYASGEVSGSGFENGSGGYDRNPTFGHSLGCGCLCSGNGCEQELDIVYKLEREHYRSRR